MRGCGKCGVPQIPQARLRQHALTRSLRFHRCNPISVLLEGMAPASALTLTLYRSTLRSFRRVRSVVRPGHVCLVAEVVSKVVASSGSRVLTSTLKEHGPIPLDGFIRTAFRTPVPKVEENTMVDTAFCALRALSAMEQWVNTNNQLYDSLEGLSDREAPAEEGTTMVVREIMREASLSTRA